MEGIMALSTDNATQPLERSGQPNDSTNSCANESKGGIPKAKAKSVSKRRKKRKKKQDAAVESSPIAAYDHSAPEPSVNNSKTSDSNTQSIARVINQIQILGQEHANNRGSSGQGGFAKLNVLPKQQFSSQGKEKQGDHTYPAPGVTHHQKPGEATQEVNGHTQSLGHQQVRKLHRPQVSRRIAGQVPPNSYVGVQLFNVAAMDIPRFYRDINARYQISRAQKTIFVLSKTELAMHNSIAQDKLQKSLANSDGAILVGIKQCEESMKCVLAGRSVNKDAHWSAQLQRLRDEYEDVLENQKLVSERLLAQRQKELERWQERIEELERPASRFLGQ